jgi:hypothetical protein
MSDPRCVLDRAVCPRLADGDLATHENRWVVHAQWHAPRTDTPWFSPLINRTGVGHPGNKRSSLSGRSISMRRGNTGSSENTSASSSETPTVITVRRASTSSASFTDGQCATRAGPNRQRSRVVCAVRWPAAMIQHPNLVPLSVKGLRRGLFYACRWRVRAVTSPKSQLSGLGWSRWIAESLPIVLPDPSR